ncbi:MAG: hypothetical protein ACLVCA_03010 [Peptoniphilus sp.]|uniref:hypothetical protein n=1 Tax=Peptoniphilus sp. TaxID=1971214 RepID=UPI00399ADAD3
MNYLEKLTNEDLKYICEIIPTVLIKRHFKKYNKHFHKIKPGFRPETLTREEIFEILYKNHSDPFISDFINSFISEEIKKIKSSFSKKLNYGIDDNTSVIISLSENIFNSNIPLYFKLAEKEVSQDYLNILSSAVKYSATLIKESKIISEDLRASDKNISELSNELKNFKSKNSRLTSKLDELKELEKENTNYIKEIQELEKVERDDKKLVSEYIKETERLKNTIKDLNDKLRSCKFNLEDFISKEEYQEKINSLKFGYYSAISEKILEIENLEAKKSNIERELKTIKEKFNFDNFIENDLSHPLRPKDMDEFEEFFKFNLQSIGMNTENKYYDLFFRYLESILFSGFPILIKQNPGTNLAKILSNTISGSEIFRSINIDSSTTLHDISNFLKFCDDRILVINNMIGSGRELEILPLLISHKSKIIILTYLYDRTLYYLPKEILEYVKYINLSSCKVFSKDVSLDEDPSIIEELPYDPEVLDSCFPQEYNNLFNEISKEFGFEEELTSLLKINIDDGEFLDCLLVFFLLPYARDVLKINPFENSLELQRYLSEDSIFYYKDVLLECLDL